MTADGGCVGRIGLGGCRFAPVVTIAGDPACVYHIAPVVKLRLAESRRVEATIADGGPWQGIRPEPVASYAYSPASDSELADNLEQLADGQEDDMGQLLTEAARRLRERAR